MANYRFENYSFESGIDKKPSWYILLPDEKEEISKKHLEEFFETMYERQEIWYKRFYLKQKPPWTNNKIFANYKYTNVYRELDNASQFMIYNILLDHKLNVRDLVWKIMFFRFYNQPDTFMGKIKLDLPCWSDFKPEKVWGETKKLRKAGRNPWHTAYLMNLAFLKKPKNWDEKEEGKFKDFAYTTYVFQKLHEIIQELIAKLITAQKAKEIIELLETLPAVSSFQSHEFFIDFCYVNKYWKEPIMNFDQNSYTNVGPGASLGLRLIFPSLKPQDQIKGIYVLRDIAKDFLSSGFKYLHWNKAKQKYVISKEPNITLHQIEMWLCEYSKYWKMSVGKGKQRSKFKLKTKQLNLDFENQL